MPNNNKEWDTHEIIQKTDKPTTQAAKEERKQVPCE